MTQNYDAYLLVVTPEADYGVIPTGTAASRLLVNSLLCGELQWSPLENTVVSREEQRFHPGAQRLITTTQVARLVFRVWLYPTEYTITAPTYTPPATPPNATITTVDAPRIAPLLAACGCTTTAEAQVDNLGDGTFKGARYTIQPRSDLSTTPSVTIEFYQGGLLQTIKGARGNFSIRAQAGQLVALYFEMTGQYVAPTKVTPNTTGIVTMPGSPLPFNAETTALGALVGDDALGRAGVRIDSFDFNLGNQINVVDRVGGLDNIITINDRAASGTITIEADPDGVIADVGNISSQTEVPIEWALANQSTVVTRGVSMSGDGTREGTAGVLGNGQQVNFAAPLCAAQRLTPVRGQEGALLTQIQFVSFASATGDKDFGLVWT